jgi:hypothetical protein
MGQETDKDLKKKHELGDEQLDKVSGGTARPENAHIDSKHHEDGGGHQQDMNPNMDRRLT